MNYATQTEQLHTFADVPRVKITRHLITGHSEWEAAEKTTVQISPEPGIISNAVVDFIASLHESGYRSREDIELLQRFAGAMGLDYRNVPGIADYTKEAN